jgi:DNA-binding MarR family transcriptional regulator
MEKARGRANGDEGPSLSALAISVLRYLMEHPGAGDTVEGVLDWWLTQRDRSAVNRSSLERALDELERADLITVLRAADHRSHYRLNANRMDVARALLKDMSSR